MVLIDMDIISFDASIHYSEIEGWWKSHNWAAIPTILLPKTGYVIEDEGKNICAGWLYKTDSAFSWIEWIISNKESAPEQRDFALDLLVNELIKEADKSGYKVIFTSVEHPKLIERYKKFGFKESEKNMTNMVRSI